MLLKYIIQTARHCHTESRSQKTNRIKWKSVIGLEIHAQLSTKSKLFSSAPAVFGAPTNGSVSLFDAAVPGTLPSLNKKAVELAAITALALGCKINPISYFDRKHYFYSDLPAGYQITQQRLPIAENGKVEYPIYQPGVHKKPHYKTSYIKQIQLEQDSGKSLHEYTGKQCFIDLNRAGIALVEIVFHPDIEDEYEACALVKEIIRILRRIGSCSCKMEEGALRVDANVSIHKNGDALGVRTEIKNLGSINEIWNAIKFEVNRQMKILNNGGFIKNETLTWDSYLNETKAMRDKAQKEDYRFMPEPNLPPLRLLIDEYSENFHKNIKSQNQIFHFHNLKERIPTLPQEDRVFLMEKYALNDMYAFNLVNKNKLLTYFKEIMEENSSRDPIAVYLLLMIQLLNTLKLNNIDLNNCAIPSRHLGELVDLMQSRRISRNTSDYLLQQLTNREHSLSPTEIVEKNDLFIISNPKELRKICLRVIEKEQVAIISYKRKKKKKIFDDLVNKVIEESKCRADTQQLPKLLSEVLDEIVSEK